MLFHRVKAKDPPPTTWAEAGLLTLFPYEGVEYEGEAPEKRFPCATGSNSGPEFPAWLRLFHALRRAFAQLGNCVRCFERQAGQQAWAEKQCEGVMGSEIAQKSDHCRLSP